MARNGGKLSNIATAYQTRHRWNISRGAGELRLTRRGMYMKIARYGIEKAA
ncbi:MAG: hypothetical protein H0W45_08330 [Acidobacteria bacterium]|nr:hypothetical protein [Acidobacteriota bacterium]